MDAGLARGTLAAKGCGAACEPKPPQEMLGGEPMKIDGSCHCGRIAYEAEVDPAKVSICHCSDCQTLTGTAFRVTIPVAEANFRLLSGEPKIYVKVAESGNKR